MHVCNDDGPTKEELDCIETLLSKQYKAKEQDQECEG